MCGSLRWMINTVHHDLHNLKELEMKNHGFWRLFAYHHVVANYNDFCEYNKFGPVNGWEKDLQNS